jgi:copper resistance protein B
VKTLYPLLMSAFLATLSTALRAENAAGAPEHWPNPMMGEMSFGSLLVDRLEYGKSDDEEIGIWDIQGWYGTDKHKVWLKSEGEQALSDQLQSAEVQLLYGRMISPFFDLQVGLRQDIKPNPDRTFVVAGVQGLAPYWFETDAAVYVSEDGDISLGAEVEYDLLITQKWILQPRLELDLSADDVPRYGTGRGLTDLEFGMRLRYEIRREFAPYAGINWSRKFGQTADYARDNGEPVSTTTLLLGVRVWF